MKNKHTPLRTCIGCYKKSPQTDLFRFGEGRGVYLCKNLPTCFELAMKKKAFSRALKKNLTNEQIEQIRKQYQNSNS